MSFCTPPNFGIPKKCNFGYVPTGTKGELVPCTLPYGHSGPCEAGETPEKQTEATKTPLRLALCEALAHVPGCLKNDPSCASCNATQLLTIATSADDPGGHYLNTAKAAYVSAYLNEKAAKWTREHPDLDTWTQEDFNRMVEQWTGEASTLWDNPPAPGQPT